MKKLHLILILFFFSLIILSCDKDDSEYQTKLQILPIKYVDESNDTTSFLYYGNNLLEVNMQPSYKETYEYSNGNITRSNVYDNGDLESYVLYENENGKITKASFFKNDDYWNKNKSITINTFLTYKIATKHSNKILNRKNEFELSYWKLFEYNNNGKISSIQEMYPGNIYGHYYTYEYDKNENNIRVNTYNVQSGKDILIASQENTFGDKYFMFKNLNLPPSLGVNFFNNLLSIRNTFYVDGINEHEYVINYIYNSFNSNNYPRSFTVKFPDGDQYSIKEIIYNID